MSSTQQLLLGEGAGGGAAPVYIEDVFSTYLFTGTGSDQTIVNNIDLATYGGLLWYKGRNIAATHSLRDNARGTRYALASNLSNAQSDPGVGSVVFNTNGWTQGLGGFGAFNFASWTFRKQPKFFDVVTYTGNGTARTIAHNLGSAPGCVIVKRTDSANDWIVWHRSGTQNNNQAAILNATDSYSTIGTGLWGTGGGTPDMNSSTISIGGNTNVNAGGGTFVAYLFAHDAGGFGLAGTDNVITCGTFTTNGSARATVELGYEPQWFLTKATSDIGDWRIIDNMRGWVNGVGVSSTDDSVLFANLDSTEGTQARGFPTSTGMELFFPASTTFIYIAIRRGPMKVPTSGTSVFAPVIYTGNNTTRTITTNFPVSQYFIFRRDATSTGNTSVFDRLRGYTQRLITSGTAAETSDATFPYLDSNTGVVLQGSVFNTSGESRGIWAFQCAPSFFDVVCYVGNGTSGRTVTHNLAATPELMIARQRTGGDWYVYTSVTGATKFLVLNATDAAVTDSSLWNNTAPTSSVFTLGDATGVNRSATNFIAYLFATCAGVSKVGGYTGTGATQTISCGFTGGARFVLIKRTDTASYSWFVWDTARGMVSGTDPRLALNNTDAESNADWVYTTTGGFQLVTSNASVNASGGSYIFLAIA